MRKKLNIFNIYLDSLQTDHQSYRLLGTDDSVKTDKN